MSSTPLVHFCFREGSVSDADAAACRIEDGVEPLKPRLAVDEVEAFAAIGAEVADNEVDDIHSPTNHLIESTLEEGQRGLSWAVKPGQL